MKREMAILAMGAVAASCSPRVEWPPADFGLVCNIEDPEGTATVLANELQVLHLHANTVFGVKGGSIADTEFHRRITESNCTAYDERRAQEELTRREEDLDRTI